MTLALIILSIATTSVRCLVPTAGMVAGEGLEPSFVGHEPTVLPLHYPAI